MKQVVIPTDFSVRSLKILCHVAEQFKYEQLHITLLHMIGIPVSLMDLLFLNKRAHYKALVSNNFRDACEIVQNKYASVIKQVTVELVYGNTRRVVKNVLEAKKTDLVILPRNLHFEKVHEDSLDITFFLQKCGLPVVWVPALPARTGVEKELIADLLLVG